MTILWVPPTTLGVSQKSIEFFNTLSDNRKMDYLIHGDSTENPTVSG